ncbi:MAG: DUF4058 family protein [Chloroflexales bacterium]
MDLGHLLHALYDRSGYDLRLNYRAETDPPLTGDDAVWANGVLHGTELR